MTSTSTSTSTNTSIVTGQGLGNLEVVEVSPEVTLEVGMEVSQEVVEVKRYPGRPRWGDNLDPGSSGFVSPSPIPLLPVRSLHQTPGTFAPG